jgi:hypothetical protein
MIQDPNIERYVAPFYKKNVMRRYFTTYKIKRDHSRRTGFFVVNVPEENQFGFGFQLNLNGTLFGFSIHTLKPYE